MSRHVLRVSGGIRPLAVTAVLVFAVAMARHTALAHMQDERAALRARWADAAVRHQSIADPRVIALQDETDLLAETVAHLEALVDAGAGPSHALDRLHVAAEDAGVEITRFKPRGVVDHGTYQEWPLEVSVDGDYHGAARFFDYLAAPPAPARLADVHVSARRGGQGRGSVSVSVVLSTFTFPGAGAPRADDGIGEASPALEVRGYDDGGRRDPFVSVAASRPPAEAVTTARPKPGLAGVSLAVVSVRGVLRHGGHMLAILETDARQSFVARSSDRLADAVIVSIDAAGVVFAPSGSPGAGARVRKPLAVDREVRR